MPRSDQAGTGAATEIVGWLVQELRFAVEPVKRDRLAARLQDWAYLAFAARWSLSTSARRLREAIKEARRQGYPVVSLGDGFHLARTREARERAAERLEKIGRDAFAEARRLREARLPGEETQLELWGIGA